MNILIGIPAYNEEMTIGYVVEATIRSLPNHDVLVVNDGSSDRTAQIARDSGAILVSLPCNLGYSYAIETILRYTRLHGYDGVVIIDADGQHDPTCLPGFISAFQRNQSDVQIGSRYIETRDYRGNPWGRRAGMLLFSYLTQLMTGVRIYDTTSGMKMLSREAIDALLAWHFLDYHAEAIVYLLQLGFSVTEYPIKVKEREYGTSMYSIFSHLWYPLSVILMLVVTLVQSSRYNRQRYGKSPQ